MVQQLDYESPIEICPGVHWVGRRVEGGLLNCNPYLLTLKRGNKPTINILTDPGSPGDFRVTASKIVRVIGDLKRLSMITLNHQDPDVILSAPTILGRFAPNAVALMTENTWRLVAHTGIAKERVKLVEQFQGRIRLKDANRELRLVPTPYCHFTGAFAIYDVENRILFTGDLFGGVTLSKEMSSLYAVEDNWRGIRMFHELYFPCNSALRYAVDQIRSLDPPVEILAPQHGSVIKGELVKEFMGRMERLQVGADLLSDRMDEASRDAWIAAANEILKQAGDLLGNGHAVQRVADTEELMELAKFDGNRLVIEKLPKRFIEGMVLALTAKEVPSIANQIRVMAVLTCEAHGLPSPNIDLSMEETETVEEFYPALQLVE